MPSGCLKGHTITVIFPNEYFDHLGWDQQLIHRWVAAIGGTHLTQFKPDVTTHLILTTKQWQRHDRMVEQALKNRGTNKRIEILTCEWLDEVLSHGKKVREKNYRWESKDALSMHQARNRGLAGVGRGPGSDMRELLDDEARLYMTEKQQREADEEVRAAQEAEAIRKEEAERTRRQNIVAWSAVFKTDKKRPRNILLSQGHHLYTDPEGFKFDVLLSKADFSKNKNERRLITVQIYESNTKPHTYAVSVQYAASREAPVNEIVAPVGSNYPTALRVFRKAFNEFSSVAWEDRLTGYDALGSQMERDFKDRAFKYVPPKHGPKGQGVDIELDRQIPDDATMTSMDEHVGRDSTVSSSREHGLTPMADARNAEIHKEQRKENSRELATEGAHRTGIEQGSDSMDTGSDDQNSTQVSTDRVITTDEVYGAAGDHRHVGGHPQEDYDLENSLLQQYGEIAVENDDDDPFGEAAGRQDHGNQQFQSPSTGLAHAQPQQYFTPHPTQEYDSQAYGYAQMAEDAAYPLERQGHDGLHHGSSLLGKRKATGDIAQSSAMKLR